MDGLQNKYGILFFHQTKKANNMLASEPVEFFFQHMDIYENSQFEEKKENMNTKLLVVIKNLTTEDVKAVCSVFHLVSTAQTLGFDTRVVLKESSTDIITNSEFLEKAEPNADDQSDKTVKEYIETQLYLGGKVYVDVGDPSVLDYNFDESESHIVFNQLKRAEEEENESWVLDAVKMAEQGQIEEISEKYNTTAMVV